MQSLVLRRALAPPATASDPLFAPLVIRRARRLVDRARSSCQAMCWRCRGTNQVTSWIRAQRPMRTRKRRRDVCDSGRADPGEEARRRGEDEKRGSQSGGTSGLSVDLTVASDSSASWRARARWGRGARGVTPHLDLSQPRRRGLIVLPGRAAACVRATECCCQLSHLPRRRPRERHDFISCDPRRGCPRDTRL